jgi:predicted P-loop ATPase
MSKISFYENVYQKESKQELNFNDYLNNIKSGLWQDPVLNYRAGKSKKELVPAVTSSATFTKFRNLSNINKHSGFLCIDIDSKDNTHLDLLDARSYLSIDKFVHSGHISVSGKGLSLYIKIAPSKHLQSFLAIEQYLANEYKIIIDKSTKDVTRLRFVSYDPELFINNSSEKWTYYLPKKEVQPSNYTPIYTGSDIDFILKQIKQTSTDLTSDYYDWIKCGLAIGGEFKEAGRSMFHTVSSNNPSYNFEKTDKKYTNLLKTERGSVNISSFFWMAKNAGLDIKTPHTRKIERVAVMRKKTVGKNGGAKDDYEAKKNATEYLKEIEDIPENESKEIIDKVFDLKSSEIEANQEGLSEFEQLTEYLQSLDLKKNLVTGKIEFKSKDVNDRVLNSIYLDAKELIEDSKFAKNLVLDILESDRIKEFDPFMEFFEEHKHKTPKGQIDELLACFKIEDNKYSEHIGEFVTKWLVSIISSAHKKYSAMILVIVGGQGKGKTEFFRNLFPKELRKYYAESKLDAGKDDEILMTNKLLIVDDEFGGKSKKEAAKLKDLASKQVFTNRAPYARYTEDRLRYAVLAGTSNELEVINDTTGNRRIIPLLANDIDLNRFMKINKTDLMIELYHKWEEMGNDWMLTTNDIKALNENTVTFTEISMEEDLILKNFTKSNKQTQFSEFMTTTEMITYCEENLNKQKIWTKKFGQILRKLDYERVKSNGRYGFWVIKTNSSYPQQ